MYLIVVITTYIVLHTLFIWFSLPFQTMSLFGFPVYITTLGALYVSYFFFRVVHSWLWLRNIQIKQQGINAIDVCHKKVGVVIPIFNENKRNVRKMLTSLLSQSHSNTFLYVVDDGSKNQEEIISTIEIFKTERIILTSLKENKGKRNAMYVAFHTMIKHGIDYMVTVDSDTTVDTKSVELLVRTIESDPMYGSVTGHVLSKNATSSSLFQKMIAMRYLYAFNVERASQSNYGSVQCNSGPLTIYRVSILGDIMEKFNTQQFLGKSATFGDDRHLTNRVLEKGYKCIYQPRALAFTDTPENTKNYWNQQLRWSKSYIRESFWQLKTFKKQSFFAVYDYLVGILLPFFLFFSVLYAIASPFITIFAYNEQIADTFNNISFFLSMTVIIAFLKGVYLKYLVSKRYIPNVPGYGSVIRYVICFGLFYILCLVYVKPLAFLTPLKTDWGTRG